MIVFVSYTITAPGRYLSIFDLKISSYYNGRGKTYSV